MNTLERRLLAVSVTGVAAAAIVAGGALVVSPAEAASHIADHVPTSTSIGLQQLRELGEKHISVVDPATGQTTAVYNEPDFTLPSP